MHARAIQIVILLFLCISVKAQEIPNGDFSSSFTSEDGAERPVYFRARATTLKYHSIDKAVGYTAAGSGLFDTAGQGRSTGYFYAFYDEMGKRPQYISVEPTMRYTIAVRYRMDASFYKSKKSAVYLQALFYSTVNSTDTPQKPFAQIDAKRSSNYNDTDPDAWYLLEYTVEVPKKAAAMGVGIYFTGNGKVWVDDLKITPLGKIAEEQTDTHSSVSDLKIKQAPLLGAVQIFGEKKLQFLEALKKYQNRNAAKTTPLGDSIWTFKPAGCHPEIRLTANMAIGILNSKKLLGNDSAFTQKAFKALDWILSTQREDGSFYWYPSKSCNVSVKDPGSMMYEGSIAAIALIEGYRYATDPQQARRYYQAAQDYCDFLWGIKPHANTNFNGFAIWALSECATIADDPSLRLHYLVKAWEFFDHIQLQQTPAGNWPDFHNRHIYYHAVISRGIASFYLSQAGVTLFSEAQKETIKKAAYASVNYLLDQIRTIDGQLQKHPEIENSTVKTPFALEVVLLAMDFPGLDATELHYLNSVSAMLSNFNLMSTQGHEMAAFGKYLKYKYD